MGEPLAVYKGGTFERVEIYNDHVELRGVIGNINLPISEIECLNGQPCKDTECRHWVSLPDLDNCLLNTDHEFTLDEAGQALGGLCRERMRQLVDGTPGRPKNPPLLGALKTYGRKFRVVTKSKSIRDMLPDPRIPVISRTRASRKKREGIR